jgi:hypothetical protein
MQRYYNRSDVGKCIYKYATEGNSCIEAEGEHFEHFL